MLIWEAFLIPFLKTYYILKYVSDSLTKDNIWGMKVVVYMMA